MRFREFVREYKEKHVEDGEQIVWDSLTNEDFMVEYGMIKETENLVQHAKKFAHDAHASIGQTRKYTGDPYIVHPAEVAQIVKSVGGSDEQIAAAWLHDTVEDTPVTIEDVRNEFGNKVADLVGWLTDVSKPEDGNRKTRKEMDRMHSAAAPAEAQTVKLADLISNSASITEHDPHFSRVYMKEKLLLLKVMTKGNKTLHDRASQIVQNYMDSLDPKTLEKFKKSLEK